METTDGQKREMKYCDCKKPKKNGGDNYCQICDGLIANLLELPVILQCELLPCPFCGNEAELIEKGNNFTKKRFVTIKCTNKNCRAEMTNGAIRNDMNWLKEISTNAWNKRAGREPQSK